MILLLMMTIHHFHVVPRVLLHKYYARRSKPQKMKYGTPTTSLIKNIRQDERPAWSEPFPHERAGVPRVEFKAREL